MDNASQAAARVLYLVRHGEAASSLEDAQRSLTPRGRELIGRLAQWAQSAGVAAEEIRHSGIRRAEETAEILAQRLRLEHRVAAWRGLHPNDDVRPIALALEEEAGCLMLVGHLPFLGRLVGLLVTGDSGQALTNFEAGAMVVLRRQPSRWEIVQTIQPSELR